MGSAVLAVDTGCLVEIIDEGLGSSAEDPHPLLPSEARLPFEAPSHSL